MAEDVKLDPYKTSKEILLKLNNEDNDVEDVDVMSINYFKYDFKRLIFCLNIFRNILQEHKILLKDDIDIILNEVTIFLSFSTDFNHLFSNRFIIFQTMENISVLTS